MITEFSPTPRIGRAHEDTALRIGYMKLTDAAPLLIAKEKGFFARHAVSVEISQHTAWAGLRDRLAGGALDAAHMLAPMPIALSLGLGGPQCDVSVTATLSRNGNTIVLNSGLMDDIDPAWWPAPGEGLPAHALAAALAARTERGLPPPVFAVVFAYSSHAYLLRHWLASARLVPERDVRFVVLPPSNVVDHLADGVIAGFCAGEPWGSRAVELGVGHIAHTSAAIWPGHPEKVLAFAAQRADEQVIAATAALIEAGRWADDPANREETVHLLGQHVLPGLPPELIELIMAGALIFDPWGPTRQVQPMVFARAAASYPSRAEAGWYAAQMRRWGHLPDDMGRMPDIDNIWRPDIWALAAARLGIEPPDDDMAVPGASGEGA